MSPVIFEEKSSSVAFCFLRLLLKCSFHASFSNCLPPIPIPLPLVAAAAANVCTVLGFASTTSHKASQPASVLVIYHRVLRCELSLSLSPLPLSTLNTRNKCYYILPTRYRVIYSSVGPVRTFEDVADEPYEHGFFLSPSE